MNNKEDTMSAQNPKILSYKQNSKIYIYLTYSNREFYSNHAFRGQQLLIKDKNHIKLSMINWIIHSQNDA